MENAMTYIERLEKDVAEIHGEYADPAEYMSDEFMPWDSDSSSDEEDFDE
jgi:hypothetical protein